MSGSAYDSLWTGILAAAAAIGAGVTIALADGQVSEPDLHGSGSNTVSSVGSASQDATSRAEVNQNQNRSGSSNPTDASGFYETIGTASALGGVLGTIAYMIRQRQQKDKMACVCCGSSQGYDKSRCKYCSYSLKHGHRILTNENRQISQSPLPVYTRVDQEHTFDKDTVWYCRPIDGKWQFISHQSDNEPLYHLRKEFVLGTFGLDDTINDVHPASIYLGQFEEVSGEALSGSDRLQILRSLETRKRVSYFRDFVIARRRAFIRQHLSQHSTPVLLVNRDSKASHQALLPHSCWLIMSSECFEKPHFLWRKFIVRFEPHEAGSDYGGLTKEWFHILGRDLFSKAEYGLFRRNSAGHLEIHPDSHLVHGAEISKMYYRFSGRLIGLALVTGMRIPDCKLCGYIWKIFTGRGVEFTDLKGIDGQLYQSLQTLLDMPDASLCDIMDDDLRRVTMLGQEVSVLPDGQRHQITNENRSRYVGRLAYTLLIGQCDEQLKEMVQGLCDVIRPEILAILDPEELSLMVCGETLPLDVLEWKTNTVMIPGPTCTRIREVDDDALVRMFWCVVERELDDEDRRGLLQFWTGSPVTPIGGFGAYECKLKISLEDSDGEYLPTASTCFNKLRLQRSLGAGGVAGMNQALRIAIENREGFGLL